MFSLTELQWIIVVACAALVGLTKTGIPGLGVLIAPLMAEVFPARASTGIVLPLLMFADIFAVGFYRRSAVWKHLFRLLPWTVVGIFIGYLAMGSIDDRQLKPLIGVIILVMLAIGYWRDRTEASMPTQWWFAAAIGVAAGVTTMMANAAGPMMIIYLLAMRLPKTQFIGTAAWYYLVLNWFKVPFSASLGLITYQSLQFDLYLFPVIALGTLIGVKTVKHIPEKVFSNIARVLAVVAAMNLLL